MDPFVDTQAVVWHGLQAVGYIDALPEAEETIEGEEDMTTYVLSLQRVLSLITVEKRRRP
jgi:hypothetical protein